MYEAGEADGVLFIAMRFVPGGDLRRVLEREGALAPGRAAEFISPVASALDAAHGAGLVHRDVKPANILVDARPGRPDHVYLSDFGVSKGAVSSVSLTGTGQFLGTPDYSAPEQIQGRAVDGRADQYALACVAYQLLAGAGAVRAGPGHGGAAGASVRAAAVAGLAAAGPARGRGSGPGPGAGQGPGGAVRVLPGVRRRAAGGARPGALLSPRRRLRIRSPADRDRLTARATAADTAAVPADPVAAAAPSTTATMSPPGRGDYASTGEVSGRSGRGETGRWSCWASRRRWTACGALNA